MRADRSRKLGEFITAAAGNRERAAYLLRKHPWLLREKTGLGETALHYLAVEGQAEAVAFLLEAGAEADPRNHFAETPLANAATCGHAEVVRLLIEHGADVNAADDGWECPLFHAARAGNAEAVRLLIEAGANVRYRDKQGGTVGNYLPKNAKKRAAVLEVLRPHGVKG